MNIDEQSIINEKIDIISKTATIKSNDENKCI